MFILSKRRPRPPAAGYSDIGAVREGRVGGQQVGDGSRDFFRLRKPPHGDVGLALFQALRTVRDD